MRKATVKWNVFMMALFVILIIASIMLFIFVGGLDKKIIDSIKVVIKIIEVGP